MVVSAGASRSEIWNRSRSEEIVRFVPFTARVVWNVAKKVGDVHSVPLVDQGVAGIKTKKAPT